MNDPLDDLFDQPKSEAKPAPVEPAKPMAIEPRLILHPGGVVTNDGFIVQAPAGSGLQIGQRYEAASVPLQPLQRVELAAMLGDERHAGSADHVAWTPQAKKGMGCLLPSVLVVIALAVGFGLGALVGSWRGSDSVVVDPDTEPVNGAYVAIFYNDTDLGSYSASQREFLNSVNTANYLEEHKANWKKIDTEPLEISNLEKPFQVMAEKHRSKEPWIVIASGKKFASEPIDSNEQAMKLLQKWIK